MRIRLADVQDTDRFCTADRVLEATMNLIRSASLLSLVPVLLLGSAALADSAPAFQGVPSESTLFQSKPAMDVWTDDVHYYVLGDNRINQVFSFNGDVARQNQLMKNIEALAMGSPVDVQQMASDSGLDLTRTQYNAMIEDAYLACEASRTPYHLCNRFISSLAPFERAVVKR